MQQEPQSCLAFQIAGASKGCQPVGVARLLLKPALLLLLLLLSLVLLVALLLWVTASHRPLLRPQRWPGRYRLLEVPLPPPWQLEACHGLPAELQQTLGL